MPKPFPTEEVYVIREGLESSRPPLSPRVPLADLANLPDIVTVEEYNEVSMNRQYPYYVGGPKWPYTTGAWLGDGTLLGVIAKWGCWHTPKGFLTRRPVAIWDHAGYVWQGYEGKYSTHPPLTVTRIGNHKGLPKVFVPREKWPQWAVDLQNRLDQAKLALPPKGGQFKRWLQGEGRGQYDAGK